MRKKLSNFLVAILSFMLALAIAVCATGCNSRGGKEPTSNSKVDGTTSSTQSQTDDQGEEEFEDDDISDIDDNYDDDNYDDGNYDDDNWDDLIGGNDFDDNWDDQYDEFEEFEDDEYDDDFEFDLTEYTNPIQLYGTAVSGNKRTVNINLKKVIHKDFLGFGDHVFVAGLCDRIMENAADKYNESLFEFDMTRTNTLGTNIARMWFQVEWIVTDTEPNPTRADYTNNKDYKNYMKGVYDFDTDIMQSVYKYVERYEEMGIDIMFNFAWKHDVRIQTWFSVPSELPVSSAPYDAKAFAKAAVACMQNFKARGYDNVPYLTYYNEPANGKDFATVGDSASYWAIIAHYTDKELEAKGIRDDITFFGCEINDLWRGHHAYMDKFVRAEAKYNAVDYLSCHHYYKTPHGDNNYQTTFEDMLYFSNEYKKRIMITEMSASLEDCTDEKDQYYYHKDWNDTYTSYIIAASNVGVKGVLDWGFGGGYTGLSGWQGEHLFVPTKWKNGKTVEISTPQKEFNEVALLCNYIDPHSDVLMVEWTGDDIRAAVYKMPDDNYTILVDTKGGENPLDVTFNFSSALNKTFYRFQYDRDEAQTIAALMPACQKEIDVARSFKDTLDAKEAMYVYTTKAPKKQIKLNEYYIKVRPGESIDFDASFIDCPSGASVKWSISTATQKEGTIDADGKYTADIAAVTGNFVTVRATLNSDKNTYATALIEIK